jgi:hypothetical protein
LSTIKIKRGVQASLPILNEGEFALATDNKNIYIGTNAGNKQLGDMVKSVYDTNGDGTVNNSDRLGNQLPAYYLSRTNHTGSQPASTIVEDANHQFVTTAEKTSWNGKADKVPIPLNNDILLCDTIGNPKLSGKQFNDAGTTTLDILSASKVIQLIGASGGGSKSRVYAYLNANQAIPRNVWTKINFNVETIDSLNEFNTTTSQFTAQNSGRYEVSVIGAYAYNNSNSRAFRFYINGSATNVETYVDRNSNSGVVTSLGLSMSVDLVAGDVLDIYTFQNSSSANINLLANVTILSITRLI